MNQPYVKKYDENGMLTNPIEKVYTNEFQNRSQRRKRQPRFMSNRKGNNYTLFGQMLFTKRVQIVVTDTAKKVIYHYTKSKK